MLDQEFDHPPTEDLGHGLKTEEEAHIAAPLPWSAGGRVVVYGTSITQDGCSSRPGMAITNILSRALNVEVINLGFSRNGRGEPDVIRIIADVPDPQLSVLDYEANSTEALQKTLPDAIRILRDRHSRVPILVVSRIAFAGDATHRDSLQARERCRDMHAELVADVCRNGDDGIHFLDGSVLSTNERFTARYLEKGGLTWRSR